MHRSPALPQHSTRSPRIPFRSDDRNGPSERFGACVHHTAYKFADGPTARFPRLRQHSAARRYRTSPRWTNHAGQGAVRARVPLVRHRHASVLHRPDQATFGSAMRAKHKHHRPIGAVQRQPAPGHDAVRRRHRLPLGTSLLRARHRERRHFRVHLRMRSFPLQPERGMHSWRPVQSPGILLRQRWRRVLRRHLLHKRSNVALRHSDLLGKGKHLLLGCQVESKPLRGGDRALHEHGRRSGNDRDHRL